MQRVNNYLRGYKTKGVLAAFILFVICLTITFYLSQKLEEIIHQQEIERFHQSAQMQKNMVSNQLQQYKGLLYNSRALSYIVPISRTTWHTYVSNLPLASEYPGLSILGYTSYITDSEKAGFIAKMKQEGFADYAITPSGKRDVYTPGTYVEPYTPLTKGAVGFDSYADPIRRKTIQEAIDTGQPVISDKVILHIDKDTSTPGFTMRIATYNPKLPQDTPLQREKAVTGFINISFHMKDLLESIPDLTNNSVEFALYDGTKPQSDNLYYSNFSGKTAEETYQTTFFAFHHSWTFVFYNLENQNLRDRFAPIIIFIFGTILSFVIFFTVAILATKKKRWMLFAEKVTEELRKSEEKYRSIFETLQDVYYQTDENGVITVVTPSIFDYTGYSPEEIIGRPAANFYAHPQSREGLVKKISEEGKVYDYEIELLSKSGKHVFVSVTAQLLVDKNGHRTGLAGMLRDISVRKHAEEQVKQKNHELEEAHKELEKLIEKLKKDKKKLEEAMTKDEFLSMAAHELRTPLGTMKWRIEMLLSEKKLNPQVRKELEKNYQNNLRLTHIVNNLLDVSRINQEKIQENPEDVDVVKMIHSVIDSLDERIHGKKLHVSVDAPEKLHLTIDENLLEEVITNIISNAVKYDNVGGKISIKLSEFKDHISFSVSDTGIGIPKKDQKTIFEKFKRGSNVDGASYEGTGLGLFVVKSYVDKWKGKIHLSSVIGKGTTITIDLPKNPLYNKS